MESSCDAIALIKNRFSETSLIVTWLTATQGKIKTSARGALRTSGPLSGRVDLFHETRIIWTPARRGDIHSLREADIQNAFQPAAPAHTTLLAAGYFTSLVDITSQPADAAPLIHDLLKRGLGYLRTKPPTRRVIRHFEKELAKCLGIFPSQSGEDAFYALKEYAGRPSTLRIPLWEQISEA